MKILIVFILAFAPLFSQITGEQSLQNLFMEDKLDQMKGMQQFEKTSIPFATKINPDIYNPGPGDVYLFKLLPYQVINEFVMVDPEGMLILPRNYGVINTSDKSLTDIRKEISEIINPREDQTFIFSLYKPRAVIVKLSGDLPIEGIQTLPSNMTVSDVLNYVENDPTEQRMTRISQSKQFNDYANQQFQKQLDINNSAKRRNLFKERNIILKRNGKSQIIDIASASYLDEKTNPFIVEGDEIIIPSMDENKNYYSVVGAVNQPSNISHRTGDDVELAIKLASGLKPSADPNNSYIFLPDGTKTKIRFNENGELGEFNPEIKSGTTIIIGDKFKESVSEFGLVNVSGQVFNQGDFVIKKGETTLKEVIDMAGGLKSEACLSLSRIINYREIKEKDFVLDQELMQKMQYFNLTLEDTLLLGLEYRMQKPRVSVNFNEILNSDDENLILVDGDYIEIPECPTRNYVMGRVKNPGYITFTAGKHPDWYINKAGGLAESAESKRSRIIRGGTNTWEEIDKNTIVMPGDIIYIPTEPLISKISETQELAALAAILGSIGAIGFFIIGLIDLSRN